MKKFAWIIFGLIFCFWLSAGAEALNLYPAIYWIAGSVSGPSGVDVNGRQVVFFKEPLVNNQIVGVYADDITGPEGLSGQSGQYILNALEGFGMDLAPGTYYAAVVKGEDNYGADPVEVMVTGNGYDFAPELVLAYGAGPAAPTPGAEPAPSIRAWFDNRLYQSTIYGLEEDKKRFYVSETGDVKIEVDIPDPYQLDRSASYALSIQNPDGMVESFDLSAVPGFRVSAAEAKPLVIDTPYPKTLTAAEEELNYIFTFNARSAGIFGPPAETTLVAAVTVSGGPVRLIGELLTYPSPVHLKTDNKVTFQYMLNRGANIDLFVFDASGRVVKKISESASAGINKVEWDLITDQGQRVGSGIGVVTLVSSKDNRLLGKGKFTALP